MITVRLSQPWLLAQLAQPMRCLSHAPFGAGYRMAQHVLWRQVRNSELTPDFDAEGWLAQQLAESRPPLPKGAEVAMLTSRDVSGWRMASARIDGIRAQCVVTLGLSNAEAVGQRLPYHSADGVAPMPIGNHRGKTWGTINMLIATDAPLSEAAQLEALTIAVQARTAAMIDLDLQLATGRATGTGTDCTVLACLPGQGRYAGLHTAVGESVGAACRQAVALAGQDWLMWRQAQNQRHSAESRA